MEQFVNYQTLWLPQECAEKPDNEDMLNWLINCKPFPPSWLFIREFNLNMFNDFVSSW